MTDDPRPWEPPLAGSEAQHLTGMLDRLRWTFRWKADGLDHEALNRRLPSSALTIGALLKHLANCEDDIFSWRIAGQRPTALLDAPDDMELDAWQFDASGDDPGWLYRRYDESVARSRRTLAAIVAEGRLDEPGHLTFGDQRPSIRRYVCDLIEEYGRHTGHADLIREAIDGRVGEDPPEGWRPTGPDDPQPTPSETATENTAPANERNDS
ncbi:mycothiol transferase [Nigerium massiliense]|uniref:mycothiol transferase n=1 Tax=Nigerium massiliense TaxID=1522317 RepID=UPI0009077612|nr:DUF664 domain-containing protein [Nigerium massiliense]